jgi:hypothetical protein
VLALFVLARLKQTLSKNKKVRETMANKNAKKQKQEARRWAAVSAAEKYSEELVLSESTVKSMGLVETGAGWQYYCQFCQESNRPASMEAAGLSYLTHVFVEHKDVARAFCSDLGVRYKHALAFVEGGDKLPETKEPLFEGVLEDDMADFDAMFPELTPEPEPVVEPAPVIPELKVALKEAIEAAVIHEAECVCGYSGTRRQVTAHRMSCKAHKVKVAPAANQLESGDNLLNALHELMASFAEIREDAARVNDARESYVEEQKALDQKALDIVKATKAITLFVKDIQGVIKTLDVFPEGLRPPTIARRIYRLEKAVEQAAAFMVLAIEDPLYMRGLPLVKAEEEKAEAKRKEADRAIRESVSEWDRKVQAARREREQLVAAHVRDLLSGKKKVTGRRGDSSTLLGWISLNVAIMRAQAKKAMGQLELTDEFWSSLDQDTEQRIEDCLRAVKIFEQERIVVRGEKSRWVNQTLVAEKAEETVVIEIPFSKMVKGIAAVLKKLPRWLTEARQKDKSATADAIIWEHRDWVAKQLGISALAFASDGEEVEVQWILGSTGEKASGTHRAVFDAAMAKTESEDGETIPVRKERKGKK